jgi:copper transport protein
LMVASFLVTGHAATAPPVWLMSVMVALHISCAGFWLAALMPLVQSTRLADIKEAATVMSEFSAKAVISVGILFLSGAVITWFQLLDVTAFYTTDYGIRLGLKIALFLALLWIARYNKVVLTPALEAGDETSTAKMRSSIQKEVVLMILILVAAVSLTLVTPPRALIGQAAATSSTMNMANQGFMETIEVSGYNMKLELTPAKTGENMAMMTFTDAEGKPVDLIKIESEWALPAAGLSGLKKVPEKMAPGMYHLMFNDLIIPGEWEVRVGAFVTDFDKYNFRTTVSIR